MMVVGGSGGGVDGVSVGFGWCFRWWWLCGRAAVDVVFTTTYNFLILMHSRI